MVKVKFPQKNKSVKNRSKVKNSKFQNISFVRSTEKKVQEKFEKIRSDLREEWHFEWFASIGSHVNEN